MGVQLAEFCCPGNGRCTIEKDPFWVICISKLASTVASSASVTSLASVAELFRFINVSGLPPIFLARGADRRIDDNNDDDGDNNNDDDGDNNNDDSNDDNNDGNDYNGDANNNDNDDDYYYSSNYVYVDKRTR